MYDLLVDRCGLAAGTATFEIGPGTGLASFELLARGARPFVALEPDERLAGHLAARAAATGAEIDLRVEGFLEADLPAAAFDLGASATAFHWLEQSTALAKVARLLRPGGWWAAWWTVFGDPDRPDPFHDATLALLRALPRSPSAGVSWRAPFALDVDARIAELEAAGGFTCIGFERHDGSLTLSPSEVRRLYATFSSINVLPPDERERLLDGIARTAEREFAGRVERNLVTAIYTARRQNAAPHGEGGPRGVR